MKISKMFAWIFGICVLLLQGIEATPPAQGAESPFRPVAIEGRTIANCHDLPRNSTLHGELIIAGDIDCEGDLKWIRITGDSIVRRQDTVDMAITNVIWIVAPEAYATFIAPTVTMTRDKNLAAVEHASLIYTYGTVDFQVYGRHDSFYKESPEDKYGLMRVAANEGAEVHSKKFIRYARDSIIVAYPARRSEGIFQEGEFAPTEVKPLPLYARHHVDDLRTLSTALDAAAPYVAPGEPGKASAVQTVSDDSASPTFSDKDSSVAGDADGDAGAGSSAASEDHENRDTAAAAAAVAENASVKAETTTETVEGDSASNGDADSAAAADLAVAGHGAGDGYSAASEDHENIGTAAAAAAAVVENASGKGETTTEIVEGDSACNGDADSAAADRPVPGNGAGDGPSAASEDHENRDTAAAAAAAAAAVAENACGKAETTTETVEGDSASNGDADSAAAAGDGAGPPTTSTSTTPGGTNAGASAQHLHNPSAAASSSSGAADGHDKTPEIPPDRADPTASSEAPEPAPAASTRHRWTSRSSTGYVAIPKKVDPSSPPPQTPRHGKGGNGGRFFSLPPCMMPHGGSALKVGEHLRGRMYNDDLERSSYVEVFGAAVVYTKTTGKAPLDAHGRPVGAPPGKSVVLAFPDRDKMARVFRNREDMEEEDAEEARVARGGKPKKVAAVMGWLPFGKHGFLRTRQRKHARAHRGETITEITDKGQLGVSVDGTRVLRVSGPSWFGLRRRDPTYEVGVTDEGIEIRRGGVVVREVKANFV